jgi:hypothetical protein
MEVSKEVMKIITLGDDTFFIAKLDEPPKKGKYLVELVIRPPDDAPGAAGVAGVHVRCAKLCLGSAQ